MLERFCKVLSVHIVVLMSLCTCTAPSEGYATIENNEISQIERQHEEQEEIRKEQRFIKKQQIQEILEKQQAEEEQQDLEEPIEDEETFYWDGEVITPSSGVANGPSGFETYYNLPMGGVVSIMRNLGYDEESYPYWVRDDGCKMLGDYIMVAANLELRPYGTVLPCSRGMAIVCDTGTFAASNPYQLDIAVSW